MISRLWRVQATYSADTFHREQNCGEEQRKLRQAAEMVSSLQGRQLCERVAEGDGQAEHDEHRSHGGERDQVLEGADDAQWNQRHH